MHKLWQSGISGRLDSPRRTSAKHPMSMTATTLEPIRLSGLAPALERICFNGRCAAKFAPRLARPELEIHILPSFSPAYTLAFSIKLERWRAAIRHENAT
jgi:G:T/U-mismatch repair DNA glycosylase